MPLTCVHVPPWSAHARSARLSSRPPAIDDVRVSAADIRQAMLLHEAAAILNLHAQAVAVTNIWSLISSVLDSNFDGYTWWRDNFLLVVGKYSLQDHVLSGHTFTSIPTGYA